MITPPATQAAVFPANAETSSIKSHALPPAMITSVIVDATRRSFRAIFDDVAGAWYFIEAPIAWIGGSVGNAFS
ncbi:hypothetical protein HFN70_22750 [Rhizobium laguerreae]|uniref:hypothetical protein n=1 Tax=Rhizobium laguerreae TaxID=1076926 RepID=UPI001C924F6F|nr:hypothetical protein [Rhizobium laguerreae]MBY3521878.1 hypothetical protein [Rhizobium laguerreae]